MTSRPQQFFLPAISSFLYASGQSILGLLLHPYRTMQLLVRGKVFAFLAAFPLFLLVLLSLLLRLSILHTIFEQIVFFRCLYIMGIFFCFYWQIMLVYLLFRFARVFWRE